MRTVPKSVFGVLVQVEVRGAFHLVMEMARLIGLDDYGLISDQQRHILRLLTPLAKLYTGKQVR